MRDLFVRHDRLSVDQVERLKKRIDVTSVKLDGIKAAAKEGWEEEADKLANAIEKDRLMIATQLNRRVYVRAWCVLWLFLRECAGANDATHSAACGTSSALCCTTARTRC
jgi:hypothetical protein